MNKVSIAALKKSKHPVELSIRTMEGNIYVAEADVEAQGLTKCQVVDKSEEPLKARSIGEMREYFDQVKISSARLIFDEAHNEMMTNANSDLPSIAHKSRDDFASQKLAW